MVKHKRWRKKRLIFGKKDKLYGGIEKPKLPKPLTLEHINRIGASDTSFIDTVSSVYYEWVKTHPLFLKANIAPKGKSRRLPSLQNICARTIAENCGDLNYESVKSMSKTCLLLIWNQILVSHNDSLGTFMTFASALHGTTSFRCHPPYIHNIDNLMNLRNDYLQSCLLPTRTHRLENLFKNIRINDLQSYLNTTRIDYNVFLDFSLTPDLLKNLDFIMIFKIRNLAGLDLSNCDIDDYTLSFLNSAIKDGKLRKLRTVRLVNCLKLTRASIESLMKLSTLESSLSLIVCDDHFPVSFQQKLWNSTNNKFDTPISGTRWLNLSAEGLHGKQLLKAPVTLQHHYLRNNLAQQIPDITSETENVSLDILIHNEVFDFDTPYHMLNQIKNNRINLRNKHAATCLIVDKTRDIEPTEQARKEELEVPNGVFTKVAVKKKMVKKRIKPRVKQVSVEDFF